MARTIRLVPHLTTEELRQPYKMATTPAAARRYHAVWLISQGHTATAAAALVGLSERWVRALVQRYNDLGRQGLADRRADNPGKAPLLNPAQQQALFAALQLPPAEGGLWTGRKVASWIKRQTGRATTPRRGWEYMRRLGFRVQSPRPRHVQAAAPAEQRAWEKTPGARHGTDDQRGSAR